MSNVRRRCKADTELIHCRSRLKYARYAHSTRAASRAALPGLVGAGMDRYDLAIYGSVGASPLPTFFLPPADTATGAPHLCHVRGGLPSHTNRPQRVRAFRNQFDQVAPLPLELGELTGHLKPVPKETALPVRDRLLQAGVAIFSKSGFNGSSVQDITEAAGVPKGSFYNHFDSKEMLGAAVIDYFWESKACNALAILEQDTLEPIVRLQRYFEQVIKDVEAIGYTCGCFIGNMTAELSDHSAIISDQLSAVYARWTRRIADCIRLAQKSGDISSKAAPDVLATFALNAWEGALLRARVTKSSIPLQQFVDTLFTQLLI